MSSTGLERLCSDNGEIVSVISEMEDISIGARRYGHFIGRDLTIEKNRRYVANSLPERWCFGPVECLRSGKR